MTNEESAIAVKFLQRMRLNSALQGIHYASNDELIRLADEMLNEGIYDDLLLAIIDQWNDVDLNFVAFCQKHGVVVADKESAQMIVLDACLRDTLEPAERSYNKLFDFVDMVGRDQFSLLSRQWKSLSDLMRISDDCFCQYVDDQEAYMKAVRNQIVKVLADPSYQVALAKAVAGSE
jgi:hypothetical protein